MKRYPQLQDFRPALLTDFQHTTHYCRNLQYIMADQPSHKSSSPSEIQHSAKRVRLSQPVLAITPPASISSASTSKSTSAAPDSKSPSFSSSPVPKPAAFNFEAEMRRTQQILDEHKKMTAEERKQWYILNAGPRKFQLLDIQDLI
jgi:hypothetical protein